MALNHIPLDEITEAHLQSLIDNEVVEIGVEYKALVGNGDEEKREFLRDISAFANASGGDFVIGIVEKARTPTGFNGVTAVEAEVLRLEDIVRQGLDPVIPGFRIQPVPVQSGGSVLVLRIPRSWLAPHMVTFKGLRQFYTRTTGGKHPMSLGEIRSAFLAGAGTAERLRALRQARLRAISVGDPVPLQVFGGGGLLVLHIIPFSALEFGQQVDPVGFMRDPQVPNLLHPLAGPSSMPQITFDGVLATAVPDGQTPASYALLSRNGTVEYADRIYLRPRDDNTFPITALEEVIVSGLDRARTIHDRVGVSEPAAVGLSLLGVAGRLIPSPQQLIERTRPFVRDDLVMPEVVIQTGDVSSADLLKPAFDMIWNAAGISGSRHYDADGNWAT